MFCPPPTPPTAQDSDGFSGAMISSVAKGGKAESTGNVHIGDLLVAVNGQRVEEMQFPQIMDVIKSVGRPLTLRLKPRPWITEIFNAEQQVIEHVVKPTKPKLPASKSMGAASPFAKRSPKSKFITAGFTGFSDMVESAVLTNRFMDRMDVHAKTARVHAVGVKKRSIAARKKLERRIAARNGKPIDLGRGEQKTHANL